MKQGNKNDLGKLRYDLIPVKPLEDIAKVLTYGAKKYGDRNWEQGIAWNRVYGAIQRHLNAFWAGEDIDPESKLPHLAHAGCEIMFLLEFMRTHAELDNRVIKSKPPKTD